MCKKSEGRSEVSTSVVKCKWVKCSEALTNRVTNIIRKCTDHVKFATYMAVWFITSFHIILFPFFVVVCMDMCFVRFV